MKLKAIILYCSILPNLTIMIAFSGDLYGENIYEALFIQRQCTSILVIENDYLSEVIKTVPYPPHEWKPLKSIKPNLAFAKYSIKSWGMPPSTDFSYCIELTSGSDGNSYVKTEVSVKRDDILKVMVGGHDNWRNVVLCLCKKVKLSYPETKIQKETIIET